MLEIEKQVLNTINKYNLIKENDKIIVAVSGGPDSMCLLDILYSLSKGHKIKEIDLISLNDYTKKLSLVNEREEVPCWGTCTEDAIRAGVVNGIVFEMDGYIDKAKELYSDVLVFLTGGHSFYFESRLKNSIFADINLVLTGLNRILEYNVEN